MLMYESASISVTFFSNMAAYRGGFEDEDVEDSCMSCLDTTKNRCLVVNFHCATNAHFQKKTTKFQVGGEDALAVSGFLAFTVSYLKERALF